MSMYYTYDYAEQVWLELEGFQTDRVCLLLAQQYFGLVTLDYSEEPLESKTSLSAD